MTSLIDSSVLVDRIPFDLVCPFAHARIGAELSRRGITVGIMIGATALARGFTVVTRDRRSFSRIPGLEAELLAGSAPQG